MHTPKYILLRNMHTLPNQIPGLKKMVHLIQLYNFSLHYLNKLNWYVSNLNLKINPEIFTAPFLFIGKF